MKTLTLIRHAKSDWSYAELMDFDRPLNPRGKRDAPEMGKRLSKRSEIPQLIYLSASVRTVETMDLLAETANWQDIDRITKDWLYLASPQEYIRTIEKMHDEVDHLCICGHNPTITSIINYYSGENISNVPTCGVGIIQFDLESWKHISQDSGQLMHYDFPKRQL